MTNDPHDFHPLQAPTRRAALRLLGGLAFCSTAARAQDGQWYPLRGDDHAPVPNFRIPVELDPGKTPGVVWKGAASGDPVLYEFFDYNCPFCRKAARELDRILRAAPQARLGLLNNAMLSPGSIQAAKVQQGVLRLHGSARAYAFHMRMCDRSGRADGASALDVTRAMGLDPAKVEASGDSPTVGDVLKRQAQLASDLGMEATPSFVIGGAGLLGWPGPKTLTAVLAAAQRCGAPVCEGK